MFDTSKNPKQNNEQLRELMIQTIVNADLRVSYTFFRELAERYKIVDFQTTPTTPKEDQLIINI